MFQEATTAAPPELEDEPLLAPVSPTLSWSWVHSISQTPMREPQRPGFTEPAVRIRRTATIRRGTRMIKVLSARQFSACLHGRLPSGFCYRSSDLAALRTADELAMLTGDATPIGGPTVVFGLRWRALDASDYAIPFSATVDDLPAYPGLTTIRPHDRLGPPVLGTGFAPSSNHLIPEFVTADLADVPLTANATLVAFTPDGPEVTLYLYLPEQRAWTRMFGPQWRQLLAGLPEVPPDQEYVPLADHKGGSTLVGGYRGDVYEAVADPPHEYRVLARARAARYPVETLSRRVPRAIWRGAECTVVHAEGDWLRLRLCRPDAESSSTLGAQCGERGVYEVWASAADVTARREVEHPYDLS